MKTELAVIEEKIDRESVIERCGIYYFSNFIRLAKGNLDHAITLYHFDKELRQFLLNQIIDFEIHMKKELLESIYQEDINFRWDDPKYYTSHFLYKKNDITNFDLMVKEVKGRMAKMNYSNDQDNENERMFYANSYGVFLRIYKNLLNRYRMQFINKIYITSQSFASRSNHLQCYLEGILRLRNRCAHGNHILSYKMIYQIKFLTFDYFDDQSRLFNKFERIIYFLYQKSTSSKEFKGILIELFDKYEEVLPYCVESRIFRKNIKERVNIFFEK